MIMCCFLITLPTLSSLALSAVGATWVTEEMEDSLEVEWENPTTEPDYFKLRFSSLLGQEKEVVVPKSSNPKSRYIIRGKWLGTAQTGQGQGEMGKDRQKNRPMLDAPSPPEEP